MPVLTKDKYTVLDKELHTRFENLAACFASRDLKSPREGCPRRRYWPHVKMMCALVCSKDELSLAVEDFKNILAEIKKLK